MTQQPGGNRSAIRRRVKNSPAPTRSQCASFPWLALLGTPRLLTPPPAAPIRHHPRLPRRAHRAPVQAPSGSSAAILSPAGRSASSSSRRRPAGPTTRVPPGNAICGPRAREKSLRSVLCRPRRCQLSAGERLFAARRRGQAKNGPREREALALARSHMTQPAAATLPLGDNDDGVHRGSAWRSAWWGRGWGHRLAAGESAYRHRVPGAAGQEGSTPR